ncbi:hypothetical protein HYS94_04025 [Candidatus Daviesbacteria bacterium]|nr:hypothetical protein [Candidatus Daviesbacteria bacterium]
MSNLREKGIVHLAIPLVFLVLAIAAILIFASAGILKGPNLSSLPGIKKEPNVSLRTQYQNPFDKSAQYVNPFAEFKNPFDALKK